MALGEATGDTGANDWAVLANSLTIGAIVHGPDGSVAHVNSAAARILRLPRSEVRRLGGRSHYWTPIDLQGRPLARARHPVLLSLADGQPRDLVPLGIKQSDGSRAWIGLRTAVLPDTEPRQVLATFTDLSELLRLAADSPASGDSVESIIRTLAGRLADCVMVLVEDRGDLFVEAFTHADEDSEVRLRAELVGTRIPVPDRAYRASAGALASTAALNWRALRRQLPVHLRPLVDSFTALECVYLEVAGSPARTWLCLFRPEGAPTLTLTEALEVRQLASLTAGRLRMEATLRRHTTAASRLEVLRQVERTLASSGSFDFALENSLRLLVHAMDVDAAAVWLRREGGDATCTALTGFTLYDMRAETRRGHLLDAVLRGGHPVTSQRLDREGVVRAQLVQVEGFVFYHGVPLTVRSQILGAVEFFKRSPLVGADGWFEFAGLAAGCLATVAAVWRPLGSPDERRQLPPDLSVAQRRVLALALEGYDAEEMARTLHLSQHTIRYHLANLYRKLGVSDRIDLMAKAATRQWL